MPKYVEGTESPSGKYVVRGGKWVQKQETGPAPAEESGAMAPEARRQQEYLAGSKVASAPYEEPSAAGQLLGGAIETGAGLLYGGPILKAATGALPSLGRVLQFATSRPGAAAIGAVEGGRRGGVSGAVEGAALGYAVGNNSARGRAAKALAEKAAAEFAARKAAAKTAAGSVEQVALEAIRSKVPLSQETIQLLTRLRGFMDTSAGRQQVKDIVKEQFPEAWSEVWKFLTAARTRL